MPRNPPPATATHERLAREPDARIGSERAFGLVIAAVLAIVAALRWWHDADPTYVALAAAAFALAAWLWPRGLRPLNLLWFRFGLVLHAVTTPIILGLMFFATVTPIGWLMRAFGKRPLALGFDKAAPSYWVHRRPPGPQPDSLPHQF
jgi:hypothetical protein